MAFMTTTFNGPQIPSDLADVTPGWLTGALARDFPRATVESITAETLHAGTASTFRLHVGYAAGGAAGPATVCLKAGFGVPHSDSLAQVGLYWKEAVVYRDVLPRTSARVASCHAANYNLETGKAFVLIEDLSAVGAAFCSPDEPLTVDQVAIGLEELAALHAAWWGDPSLTEARWTHHGVALGDEDPYIISLNTMIPEVAKTPHGGAVVHLFHRPEVYGPALARLRQADDATATCLIHGDAHVGNFFADADGRPGMVDFQCVQRGNPTHDLANFIGSSLDVLDRRAHERELVHGYRAALERHGVSAPGFDDVWLGYRQHMLYALWAWLLTTDVFQPELSVVTNVFRFGLAALDLNSLGSLE
jgi:hypothetical protein